MENQSIPRRVVEIYSKPDCSLCDAALATLKSVKRRIPFDLVERDVRQDATLAVRWRYDIPVVSIDGVVAFLGRLTEEAFERRLAEGADTATGVSSTARGDGGTEPG
jgi:glutaredoxin